MTKIYSVAMAARDHNFGEKVMSYMKSGVVRANNQEEAEKLGLELAISVMPVGQFSDHTVTVYEVPSDIPG